MHFVLQNYETSESKLRREFEQFGKIQKVSSFFYGFKFEMVMLFGTFGGAFLKFQGFFCDA